MGTCYNRIRNRKKIIWSEKCPSALETGKISVRNISSRGNVRRRNIRRGCVWLGKCQSGKCPSVVRLVGEMLVEEVSGGVSFKEVGRVVIAKII